MAFLYPLWLRCVVFFSYKSCYFYFGSHFNEFIHQRTQGWEVNEMLLCDKETESDVRYPLWSLYTDFKIQQHQTLSSTFKQTQVHKATIVDGQRGKLSWLHTFQLSCVGQTSRTHDNTRPWPIFLSSLEPSLNTLPLHHPNEEVVEQGAAST